MKSLSMFRLTFALMFVGIGGTMTAQSRFTPGKIVDDNSNPYKQEPSLLERFGFKRLDTVTVKSKPINAMDHVLQSRPGIESLDKEKHASKGLSIGFVGAGNVLNQNQGSIINTFNYTGSIYYTNWFNAVSGLRFGLNGGVLDSPDETMSRDYFLTGNLSVDYIMSLTNYILEYNQSRRLNLNGFVGISGGMSYMSKDNKEAFGGGRVGLQLTYSFTPGFEMFLEPSIGFYSDGYNLTTNWRKFDMASTVMAGMTYKMVPVEARENLTPFTNGGLQNTFISVGGGWSSVMLPEGGRSNIMKYGGPSISVGIGKWITPISGVRLSANMSYPKNEFEDKLSLISGRLDYMLGLSSLFEGYKQDRIFKMSLVAGVEGGMIKKDNFRESDDNNKGMAFGAGFGLNADIRLSKNLSIFLEPRISIYQSKYLGGMSMGKFDMPASFNMGLTWYPVSDYMSDRFSHSSDSASHWADYIFVSGALGGQTLVTGDKKDGIGSFNPAAALYIGKTFNHVFTPRLGLQVGMPNVHAPEIIQTKTALAGVSLDAMVNLNTLFLGKDQNSWVDFSPFIGYGANFISNPEDNFDFISSVRAGLHLSTRISPTTSLFIEPNISLYSDGYNFMKEDGLDVVPGVFAGVTYYVIPREMRTNTGSFISTSFWDNTFVTLAGGANVLVNGATLSKNMPDYLNPKLAVGLGKWLSPSSGLRLMASGAMVKHPATKDDMQVFGGQFDYLLNINSLFNGYDASRVFSLYGIVGLDGAIPEKSDVTSPSIGFGLGLQANFRLSATTDFFIEPRFSVFQTSYAGGISHKNFDAPASVMLGFNFNRSGEYLERVRRESTSEFKPHGFISLSGGVNSALSGHMRILKDKSVQPIFGAHLGYFFNEVSGLRLGGKAGLLGEFRPNTQNYMRTKMLSADLSYMFNITNALLDFRHDRRFNASAIIGASAMYNSGPTGDGSKQSVIPGMDLGLQFNYFVSPYVGIFLEPSLSIYNDKLIATTFTPLNRDLLASLKLGINYYLNPVYTGERKNKMQSENAADNSFVSIGGSANFIVSTPTLTRHMFDYVTPGVSFSAGKWFNAYSAMRFSVAGATATNPRIDSHKHNMKMLTLSADYMYNLHTIMFGYDPGRNFNMYGLLGLSTAFSKETDNAKVAVGGNFGFQGNFKITDVTSFFIEPKVSVFNSNYARGLTSSKADVPLSLALGFNFTRNNSKDHVKNSFENESFLDNTYISVSGGANALMSGTLRKYKSDAVQPIVGVTAGKWFNPVSGIKLHAFGGSLGEESPRTEEYMKTKVVGLDLDYVFNITNFLCGYSKDRLFSVNAFFGATALFNTNYAGDGSTPNVMFGGNAGIQAGINVTKDLCLYIEPKIGLYDGRLETREFLPCGADVWASTSLGLTYNINGANYRRSKEDYNGRNKAWVYGGAGVGTNLSSNLNSLQSGMTFTAGLESEISPVSRIRIGYKYSNYPCIPEKATKDEDMYNGIDLNYMANVSNFVGGINDRRIVSVLPFAGVSMGMSKFEESYKFAATVNGGLNLSFRLLPIVDLFIEPRVDVGSKYLSMYNNHRPFDINASVSAGLKFKIK